MSCKDEVHRIAILTLKICQATLEIIDPKVKATAKKKYAEIRRLSSELLKESEKLP